jgi:ATP/ADP translocase
VARGLLLNNVPALHRTLSVLRGGDTSDVAVKTYSDVIGGAVATTTDFSTTQSILSGVTPQGRSVAYMAIAMALHYLGYSFARPSTIALFTSKKVGFQSPAAFPLAMAFISPVSLGLLILYGSILEHKGPRGALIRTTALCGFVLLAAALAIEILQEQQSSPSINILGSSFPLVKLLVGGLFIFRESYVQLLTSQHWSFMASICNPSQSTTWFAWISGVTSILSATGGWFTSFLVKKVGLTGVVALAGISLLVSLFVSEQAYSVAERHGFNPDKEHFDQKAAKLSSLNKILSMRSENMLQKAANIFDRVPSLRRLFWEVLSCQGLATLLNVCFVTKLSEVFPNDQLRAGWTGRFYATINVISCLIQFGMLPKLIKAVEPSVVWRVMPMVMICLTLFQSTVQDPSLYLVSGSLLVMKTLEFSARRLLDEMVYVPLDYESRYVGKEVIGVFGYRFGKSGMSLALSALTSCLGNLGVKQLSQLTTLGALSWFACSWQLSNLVPTKAEAEESYAKIHGKSQDGSTQ